MKKSTLFSRRYFLKGAGILAAVPLLPNILAASAIDQYFDGPSEYRILCANIRVALAEDEQAGVGWQQRKDVCINIMKKHKPDIMGLQEVLRIQNDDLKKAFPDYFSFGFEGPEMDAHKEGYHGIAKNPIFFAKRRFTLLSAGTFWLSATPLIGGSASWETARARNASWVRLLDHRTGKEFRFVNVHLDHVSQSARAKQIQVVLAEANQYPTDFPQILTGDLNSGAGNGVYEAIEGLGWTDTFTAINGGAEPGYTVHQFKGEKYEKKERGKKIDFIFTKGPFKPVASTIIKDQVNGIYPSDHYFISATVTL